MIDSETTQNVHERLKKILIEQLRYTVDSSAIREESPLLGNGLGLSSLDVVSLIIKIEEEFDIFFDAREIGFGVETFGSLLMAVRKKLR